jgi:high affinity Mn2+ porin
VDRFWYLGNRAGAVRFLVGLSRTQAPTWNQATAATLADPDVNLDALAYNLNRYRIKTNLAINAEQALTDTLGAFMRLGWNDGATRNWMFTEQDWSVSAGLALNGLNWGREGDTVGFGFNLGGISKSHRRFLEAGGIGFITGDGRLSYAPEAVVESYYDARLFPGLNVAANLQLVTNPAYNADRGPVVVLGMRLHAAF